MRPAASSATISAIGAIATGADDDGAEGPGLTTVSIGDSGDARDCATGRDARARIGEALF